MPCGPTRRWWRRISAMTTDLIVLAGNSSIERHGAGVQRSGSEAPEPWVAALGRALRPHGLIAAPSQPLPGNSRTASHHAAA